jgi:hypothetical protein
VDRVEVRKLTAEGAAEAPYPTEIVQIDQRRITIRYPPEAGWKPGDPIQIQTTTDIYLGELQAIQEQQAIIQARHRIDVERASQLRAIWATGSFD